jgi:hypothetical protein
MEEQIITQLFQFLKEETDYEPKNRIEIYIDKAEYDLKTGKYGPVDVKVNFTECYVEYDPETGGDGPWVRHPETEWLIYKDGKLVRKELEAF